MIAIDTPAPDFALENQRRERIRLSDFRGRKNVLIVFHPLAFTPVCADEMTCVQRDWKHFEDLETHVLSISVDSSAVKAAWARELGGVSYDLLADFYPHGAVADAYGVLNPAGFADRAVILVDKEGIVRYRRVYDMPESPDLDEVFATLERLQQRR